MTDDLNPNLPLVHRALNSTAEAIDALEDFNAAAATSLADFERAADSIDQLREQQRFLHAIADAMLDEPAATMDDIKPRFRKRGLAIVDRYLAGLRAA